MLYWCNKHGAVEPIVKEESTLHSEVDTRCYEERTYCVCPECGRILYEPAVHCACGGYKEFGKMFCPECESYGDSIVQRAVAEIVRSIGGFTADDAEDLMIERLTA